MQQPYENLYANPHDWLNSWIHDLESKHDHLKLAAVAKILSNHLGPDGIKAAFPLNVDRDGYMAKRGQHDVN